MEVAKEKRGFKESLRKLVVSLKKRTNRIPQFVMVGAFIFYSCSLSTISNTTAFVNKTPMGLCTFVVMLLSTLAFVCSLNAFPARSKPKLFMVILMYLMQVIVVGADIWYLIKVNQGLNSTSYAEEALRVILGAKNIIIIHVILVCVSIVLFLLVPVIRKLLFKIDTSVELSSQKIDKIELQDE